ncbi:uncharacterized protein LOC111356732 [Spodoptera litura]|uniref:Uncharacterized protein LOC111356732 n=1 Tax=Spodoptera litura TaxID=69820 RepID=A0A9J7EBE9_SPOLT|nr:uncharacterized protein LOC111356732 [Spodoptera litura]
MLSQIFIITLIVGIASAATTLGRPPPKPAALADKEGCYIKEIKDVIPFGESVAPLGSCHRIYCGRMLAYASCSTVATDDPTCHLTDEDLSKPYPHCCPHLKCDAHVDLIPLIGTH